METQTIEPTEQQNATTPAADITESSVSAEEQTPQNTEADASTTPEAKPDGDAKVEPEEVVYDLKAPEGVDMTPETLDDVTGLAREIGLSNEDGQKLVEFGGKMLSQWAGQLQEQQEAAVQEWAEELKADPELGGAKLDQTEKSAAAGRDAIFPNDDPKSKAFKDFLNESGLGNHPEMVRLFVRVNDAIGNDTLVSGSPAPASAQTRADKLYG